MKFELNIAGQKQTIDVNDTPVVANVSLPITITPIIPPAPQYLNLRDFGAIADGRTDCQAAFAKALAAAKSGGKQLYVPPGKYVHSSTLDVDSVTMFGDGDLSEVISNNPLKSAIYMKGTNPTLRSLKHTVNTNGIPRQHAGDQASIVPWFAQGFTVENVTVFGGASIGVLVYGSNNGKVLNCRVNKTLADSYHMTNGSRLITVSRNWSRECGDDGVAVVSYKSNANICSDIVIAENDVGYNTWGRGITISGGRNIKVTSNIVTRTNGAGLLIASEGEPWNTYGVDSIVASKNSLIECVTNTTIGHPAALVTGRVDFPVSNVLLESTVIKDPRNDAFRFDQHLSNIIVKSSVVTGVKVGYKTFNVHPNSAANVTI